MDNVLVLGSEGSLGKFVVAALQQKEEYNIIRTSRSRIADLNDDNELDCIGDLTDVRFVNGIFDLHHIDYVIHCAARWNGFNNDISILQNNSQITLNLIHAVRQHEAISKIAYISSSAVYENSSKQDEQLMNLCPSSAYGVSKLFSENCIRIGSKGHSYEYVIFRPFHIVSPEEKHDPESSHICTNLTYQLIEKQKHVDISSISHTHHIPLTWVEDVARCVVGSLTDSRCNSEIFNIGSLDQRSPYDVLCEIVMLAEMMDLVDSGLYEFQSEDLPISFVDGKFEKIANVIDWECPTLFKDCIRKFMEYKYGAIDGFRTR